MKRNRNGNKESYKSKIHRSNILMICVVIGSILFFNAISYYYIKCYTDAVGSLDNLSSFQGKTPEEKNKLLNQILKGLYLYAEENEIDGAEPFKAKDVFGGNYTFQEILYLTAQNIEEALVPIKQYLKSNHSQIYRKAIEFIRNNYKRPIGLNDLGEALDVTPSYISRVISREGNQGEKTFVDLITSFRINEAKRKIQEGDTLKNIAYEVGFHSASYFSKCFKKITGVSPKEYQEKMLLK